MLALFFTYTSNLHDTPSVSPLPPRQALTLPLPQLLNHWQGSAPCMVLFVRAPTTMPLPATQKPYLSYKRLPIPPQ